MNEHLTKTMHLWNHQNGIHSLLSCMTFVVFKKRECILKFSAITLIEKSIQFSYVYSISTKKIVIFWTFHKSPHKILVSWIFEKRYKCNEKESFRTYWHHSPSNEAFCCMKKKQHLDRTLFLGHWNSEAWAI